MRLFVFFFIMVFLPLLVLGQSDDIGDDAKQLYKDANEFNKKGDYQQAIDLLKEAISDEPNFLKAVVFIADIYNFKLQDLDNAIDYYEKAMGIEEKNYIVYRLANCLFSNGEYEKAKENYSKYLKGANYDKSINEVKNKIKKCDFAIEAMKTPVPFDPINISNVNSVFPEYNPVLATDGSYMIFTRMVKKRMGKDEDLFVSFNYDDGWAKPKPLSVFFNFPNYSEGAHCFCSDDNQMYFTACNRSDSKGRCDIYFTQKDGYDNWQNPINLSINSSAWDSQPSVNGRCDVIFFSSDRAGGVGGKDIWMSKKQNGKWSKPKNVRSLNTLYDEVCPFISRDGKTLYLSSNGHLGMGKLDFFISKRDAMGNWSKPVNIGYPINSSKNEYGLFVAKDGKTAYFSTDNLESKGDLDIYSFILPENISTKSISNLVINILDNQGNYLGEKEIVIYIYDRVTGEKQRYETYDSKYFIDLDFSKTFAMQVYSKGYMMYSDNLSLDPNKDEYEKNVYLDRVTRDSSFVLKNILFPKNGYEITPDSYYELDILVNFLKLNKDIGVEVGGHTDDTGDEYFNWQLSGKRARVIYEYLIKKGISKDRLWFKGYGYSKPISLGKDELSRSKNRRTEVKILEIKKN